MAKYAPLEHHLAQQRSGEVPMSFDDIERVIGRKLPPAADRHRAWWSNNAANNVMTKAWLSAGFITERVDLAGRRLVFRRAGSGEGPQPARGFEAVHGALRGMILVAPGVDLAGADSDWADFIDAEHGPDPR